MKRLILITALIIIAKITFAHIYNIPSFIWEIQEQYANERHDIVKIKLENEGFNLIKTMPDYDESKKQYKNIYSYSLKNSFEYMLFDFITTIENEVIAYELNITIKNKDTREIKKEIQRYLLEKPTLKFQSEYTSWMYDTTLIYGRRNDIIFGINPLYINCHVAEYENLYVHVIRNKTTIPILELNDAAFEKNPIEIIKLKKVGYHYFIMVRIGIKDYTFLFDTGATDFLINKSIEKDLIESGIIKKEDYMGVGIYEIANGQKIRIQKVRIRKIKIGNIILTNIEAGITENSKSQPLFPISALNKFDSYKINNKNGTLIIKQW